MKTESKTDAERLEVEKQIMTGLQAEEHGRLQAARGLRRLDDADLWPKCTSKAKYLWEKFNISEERAKQLLDFLMIREAIRGDRVPDNERQTRALKKTDAANWQAVWDRACTRSGRTPPTSTIIERIVRKGVATAKVVGKGPGTLAGKETGNIPSAGDESEKRLEPEEYILDLELTVKGSRDPHPMANIFQEWHASETDVVNKADFGVRFKCGASKVSQFVDTLACLLDGDVETVTITINKREPQPSPNNGCD